MSTISQQPLFVILFSAIGACIALIMIYMAISFELERRQAARDAQSKSKARQAHPLAWRTKPDPMPES
jgi:hypothetical protein